MDRKGIEMQFNWIFVMLAGAVILGFFFSVVKNQIEVGDSESALKVQRDLEFLLQVSQGTSNSEKTIAFGKRIEFTCDPKGASQYIVEGSSVAGYYDFAPMFSPPVLDGRELLLSTASFKMPFRVSNLLYLTNKDIEYVFVNDPVGFIAKLYSSMPRNSTKSMIESFFPVPFNNFDETVLVVGLNEFNAGIAFPQFNARPSKLKVVVIDWGSSPYNGVGEVKFYEYDVGGFNQIGRSFFVGPEMLLGAVISHDAQNYKCNYGKVMRRIVSLCELHMAKMDKLSGLDSDCAVHYGGITSDIGYLKDSAMSAVLSDTIPAEVLTYALELRSTNTEVIQKTSCTPLY